MQEVLEFRKDIDSISNLCKSYDKTPSRNLSMALAALDRARNWAGMVLKELGGISPYKLISFNPTEIPPTSDKDQINATQEDFLLMPLVTRLDYMRNRIDDLSIVWRKQLTPAVLCLYRMNYTIDNFFTTFVEYAWFQVYNYLTEARMALGEELGKLRDESLAHKKLKEPAPDSANLLEQLGVPRTGSFTQANTQANKSVDIQPSLRDQYEKNQPTKVDAMDEDMPLATQNVELTPVWIEPETPVISDNDSAKIDSGIVPDSVVTRDNFVIQSQVSTQSDESEKIPAKKPKNKNE